MVTRVSHRGGQQELAPTIALLIAVLLCSGAFAAIRVALDGFEPGTLALVRFALASILVAWALLGERPSPLAVGGGVVALVGVAITNRRRRPLAARGPVVPRQRPIGMGQP